jgi:hypothetical protein
VGNDPTGLARWVSVLMEGRENHKTRFVQAYNPCFSTLLNSVYQQHVRYLRDENQKDNPHKAFEKKPSRQHLLNGWAMEMQL